MATVSKWTPFGVALDITANPASVTRISATQFTVKINASWETYYNGAQTKYGMTASSGGGSVTLKTFNNTAASSGSGSLTGTYSISGNGAATKTITVTFRNFNNDNGDSATKNVTFSVNVPAWTSYTISYNANGGSGAPGNQTKWKDQTLTLSSTKPTRTGYSFLGWSTSSSATSATYSAGGKYTANASATLYAVWKANTYTVTYNANGGSGAPASQTKTHDKALTLSSARPIRTNYNFKGWSTSASATTITYAPGASYVKNAAVTLYAVWELAYTKPRINNLSITRSDSSGTPSDEGANALIAFDWACDKSVSSIVVKWKRPQDSTWSSYTVSASGTSGKATCTVGSNSLSTESSYDFHITVADGSGSSYATTILTSMLLTVDYLRGGRGIAFGKTAELEDVCDINFQTRLLGGVKYVLLTANTDLNDCRIPGFYIGDSVEEKKYVNCPSTLTSGTFTLEVLSMGEHNQVMQRLTQCHRYKPTVFERIYYETPNWTGWSEWYGDWHPAVITGTFEPYNSNNGVDIVRYRKNGQVVNVRGIIKPTVTIPVSAADEYHIICNLPEGYRPDSTVYTICQGSGPCTWLLRVEPNGDVLMARYRDGTGFIAAANTIWMPFNVTYIV